MNFVDNVINISKEDAELNHYMFEQLNEYNSSKICYFSFIIERLFSLLYYLNDDLKFKKFPIENECYFRKYGTNHSIILNLYNIKK